MGQVQVQKDTDMPSSFCTRYPPRGNELSLRQSGVRDLSHPLYSHLVVGGSVVGRCAPNGVVKGLTTSPARG